MTSAAAALINSVLVPTMLCARPTSSPPHSPSRDRRVKGAVRDQRAADPGHDSRSLGHGSYQEDGECDVGR
jgi:hypothetical protein